MEVDESMLEFPKLCGEDNINTNLKVLCHTVDRIVLEFNY
jgi:hypothetical protein